MHHEDIRVYEGDDIKFTSNIFCDEISHGEIIDPVSK